MGLNPFEWDNLNVIQQADLLAYNNIRDQEEADLQNAMAGSGI
jgi:hypothetical protein